MRIVAAALLLSIAAIAHADGDYRYRVVDFPGATNTFVFAVNNAGQFVGAEQDAAGVAHAIVDDGRTLQLLDLSALGAIGRSFALSTNNRGDIAGVYRDTAGVLHGYVHHADNSVSHIDYPGATGTEAFGVNDVGSVIGIYFDAQGNAHAFVHRAGHYYNADLPNAPSTVTTPLSINDSDQIVGEYQTDVTTNGFGYLQSRDGHYQLTTAPGSAPEGTYFISINNRGQILGAYADSAGAQHSFLRSDGDYRPFDLPARIGAALVLVQTVNDRDDIVGYYFDASGVAHGFIAVHGEQRD
ncbi:MAG TPA: hypothetical protein VEY89_05290 [Candidatus Dormibacteraeota bacterium]|nr:hypothetical protein [Candidatus Dormibacteraeota bacterium]